MFQGLVVQDSRRFEIVVPRTFAMVCFRLLPQGSVVLGEFLEEANELNRKLLESVNSSGKAYMTHAVVGGVYMIWFAVGATLTEENHVNAAWKVVQEHAAALLVGN